MTFHLILLFIQGVWKGNSSSVLNTPNSKLLLTLRWLQAGSSWSAISKWKSWTSTSFDFHIVSQTFGPVPTVLQLFSTGTENRDLHYPFSGLERVHFLKYWDPARITARLLSNWWCDDVQELLDLHNHELTMSEVIEMLGQK